MGDSTNSANAVTEQLEMFEARLMKRFDDRLQHVLQRFNPPPPPPPNQLNGGGGQVVGQQEAPVPPEHGPPPSSRRALTRPRAPNFVTQGA